MKHSFKMHLLATVFLYFVLINGTVFMQSQSPQWTGTFSIINTQSNAICNQTACCCYMNLITITQEVSGLLWTANISGTECGSDSVSSMPFPTPSSYVFVPITIDFYRTDTYVITLSSDSSSMVINDTTNQQCTSIAQRVISVSTTIATNASTTMIPTIGNATSTVGTSLATSTNDSNTLRHALGYNWFLCLLAMVIAYAVGN